LARMSAAKADQPSRRWRRASHKTSRSVACHLASLPAGSVVLDLAGQLQQRDHVMRRDGRACFEALIAAPDHECGKVIDAGHEELSRGAGRRDDIYQPESCRQEEARDAAAVSAALAGRRPAWA
jgi:hypothetical protein